MNLLWRCRGERTCLSSLLLFFLGLFALFLFVIILKNMEYEEVIKELKSLSNPTKENIEGMKRFGITPKTELLCVPIPKVRKLAKKIGKNHVLALKLWDSKMHEARILAGIIDEPEKVTESQMEKWVKGFDSWDVCDQTCGNLFDKTKFSYKKIGEWADRKEEFVKRTPFALMAWLSVHDKKAKDSDFIKFFPLIEKASTDERNFVKKAVNWALRQIGKRNARLNKKTIALAKKIEKKDSKSAKWIARNAIKELKNKRF